MKTANVYDIERALQQPITPEQRQTAAANNPVAALIAQRLDGVEGSLRQKLQTPPPPQGTVMNQYYQWPQQQPEMGLAQPGLEQMAQQYAAGGLVAFADGGPVYDYDGGDAYGAYAEGGLATMLPMGYAGEDDVPVFNTYAGGGNVLKGVFPATQFDEDEYEEGEGENFGDVGSGVYGLSEKDIERGRRQKDIANRVVEEDAMKRYSAGPGDIIGTGVEGVKKVGSALMDMAFTKDPAWEARQAEKKAREADYYKTTAPPPSRNKPAEQGIAAVPTEEPGLLDRLKVVLPQNTESGEDVKYKQQQEDKTQKASAHYDALEKPIKARKASVSVPSANPVRTAEGPGVSVLSPQAWGGGPLGSTANYEPSSEMVEAPASEESRVNLNPSNNATAAAIVNSNLSADQQIAALAKYFQTDTSEAMRIKGEMEKENAHAGNVGIMAVLANALGMGLGTYGTGAARWGAGLMAAAQGFMSEEERAARRQAELNKLRREVAETPSKRRAEATKIFLEQQEAGRKAQKELANNLILGKQRGEYALTGRQITAGASMRNKDVDVANRGSSGGMNEYQSTMTDLKAKELAQKDVQDRYGSLPPTPQNEAIRRQYFAERYNMYLSSVPNGGSRAGSVTPDLVIGRIQGGQFVQ